MAKMRSVDATARQHTDGPVINYRFNPDRDPIHLPSVQALKSRRGLAHPRSTIKVSGVLPEHRLGRALYMN